MRKGFTLIELSIVLVIIGLIVGGVLVGRDLVKAARIRGLISEMEQYQTALRTFQTKYGCPAGDCKNASDFFGAANACDGVTIITTGACNGDGNGYIDSGYSGGYWEERQVPYELQLAGLLPGKITAPGVASGGADPDLNNWWVFVPGANLYASTKYPKIGIAARVVDECGSNPASIYPALFAPCPANKLWLALGNSGAVLTPGRRGLITNGGGFPAGDLFIIDTKLDDGLPNTGRMLCATAPKYANTGQGCQTTDNTSALYDFTTTGTYNYFIYQIQ